MLYLSVGLHNFTPINQNRTMAYEIAPKQTTRAFACEFWMKAPNAMVIFIKTIDVTRLVKISKKQGLKFNMLPVGDKQIQYDAITVDTIGKKRLFT